MSDGCCAPAAIEIEQFLAPAQADALPVVVIGAGPVGLAAAAHLAERGLRLPRPGGRRRPRRAACASGDTYGCSRPWRYNIDPAARRLLDADGWTAPDPDWLPTGAELVDDYLAAAGRRCRRSAARPLRRPGGGDQPPRPATGSAPPAATTAPFLVRLADGGEDSWPGRSSTPPAPGTPPTCSAPSGLPAHGEADAAGFVEHALPDVLGADRERFAGRHTLVVGAGHSAANTLLALADLADQAPGTEVDLGDPRRRRRPAPTAAATPTPCPPAARSAPGCARTSTPAASRLLTGFSAHALTPRPATGDGRSAATRPAPADDHGRPDRGRHRLPPRPLHRRRAAPGPGPDPGLHPRPRPADRPEPALLRHRPAARRRRARPTRSPATTPSA